MITTMLQTFCGASINLRIAVRDDLVTHVEVFANSYIAGGTQLKNFIESNGDQPDRKGKGALVDGDY